MKQSLSLKLGQHLTMTPQLQQAIETNPMLEFTEDDEAEVGAEPDATDDQPASSEADEFRELAGEGDDVAMPEELPVDSAWEDVFQTAPLTQSSTSDDYDPMERNASDETLADHLLWQLNLTPMSDRDRSIALAIIDAIDVDGMCTASIEEIVSSFADEDCVEGDEVGAVLKLIQQFDPPGIAARDLRECLLIQLRQLDSDTEWLSEALQVVTEHLDLLAAHDLAALKRKTHLDDDELREVVRLIQTLHPRPGAVIASAETEYIVPDVLVRKDGGKWVVELNPETAPRVRINAYYAGMVRRADSGETNTYLRDNLQEARWFL